MLTKRLHASTAPRLPSLAKLAQMDQHKSQNEQYETVLDLL